MNDFTVVFLIALAASFGVEYWLSRRQSAHVRSHREQVPEAFVDTVSPEAHQKAADYTIDKGRVGDIDRIIGVAVLLIFTLGGGINAIEDDSAWVSTLAATYEFRTSAFSPHTQLLCCSGAECVASGHQNRAAFANFAHTEFPNCCGFTHTIDANKEPHRWTRVS